MAANDNRGLAAWHSVVRLPEFPIEPARTALVVIDLTYQQASRDHGLCKRIADNGFGDDLAYYLTRMEGTVVPNVAGLAEVCRRIGAPVVYTLPTVHAEIGEVVAGLKPGRERDDELIVDMNIGMGVEDVVLARALYERALDLGVGRSLGAVSREERTGSEPANVRPGGRPCTRCSSSSPSRSRRVASPTEKLR